MVTNKFIDLVKQAHEAGMVAGTAAKCAPMTVVGHGKSYFIPDGVCGFAWVNIQKGQMKFVNFLKKLDKGYKAYHGGWDVPCHEFGQSMQRKEAYCAAYAQVLRDGSIKAYAQSRID
jgi:hypothetical protein